MKKVAILGLLLGTMMTSSAFAGANIIATGSASVRTSPDQVNDELMRKLKIESHSNAFGNCTRNNDYDMCEMTIAHTSCEHGIERALTTLTDIISEDTETAVSVTITCTTDLEF